MFSLLNNRLELIIHLFMLYVFMTSIAYQLATVYVNISFSGFYAYSFILISISTFIFNNTIKGLIKRYRELNQRDLTTHMFGQIISYALVGYIVYLAGGNVFLAIFTTSILCASVLYMCSFIRDYIGDFQEKY